MTRIIGYPYLSAILISLLGMSSCYELQSDEELREDIVGTWLKEECEYPFGDFKDVTETANLLDRMTFHADGSITEDGLYAYCCSADCDTAQQGACTWIIENGELTIIPDKTAYSSHLNQAYPIKCLDEDMLVFDNVTISGVERTKTCFRRQ